MLGPAEINYPCITYTEESSGRALRRFYYVRPNRQKFFRGWRWPPQDWYVPGGILDSSGRHFRVRALIGWTPKPAWLRSAIDDSMGGLLFRVLRGSGFKLDLAEPETLNLDEFKGLVSLILYGAEPRTKTQKKDFARTSPRLQAAQSYSEVVKFAEWFQLTDGGSGEGPAKKP